MVKRAPTPSEARDGAEAASSNAVDLLKAADVLAEHNLLGPGTSLAILSLEEAVKSRALMAIAATGYTTQTLGFTADDHARADLPGQHPEPSWAHPAGPTVANRQPPIVIGG